MKGIVSENYDVFRFANFIPDYQSQSVSKEVSVGEMLYQFRRDDLDGEDFDLESRPNVDFESNIDSET